jgi:hypothetical protein
MKARIITSVAAAGALAIGGCSQDLTPTPAVPTQSSFSAAPAPLTCDFTAMRNNAAAYLTSPGPVNELITAMSRATGANVNARGFDILTAIAAAANAGPPTTKGTTADGSNLANATLACMVVTGYTAPIDFSAALGGGIFEVRDGNGSSPVKSHLLDAGFPAFGAEPSTGNWPLGGRTLFYGSLLTGGTLAGETAAGDVFELSTLPSGLTFNPEIKAGVCTIDDPNARILHLHATDPGVILPPTTALSFCAAAPTTMRGGSSLFAMAVNRIGSLFVPASAQAATSAFRVGGGGTGLVGGLSKIGPVTYTSTMAWVVKPGNTSRSKSPQQFVPTVTVQNASSNGNALQGATITLVVTTNKGSFNITGNVATTNSSGIAVFPNLKIDKPGGYTMTAVSELGGTTSTFFNIDGH